MLLIALMAGAASPAHSMPDKEKNEAERSRWMLNMQQRQNDFIAKELGLTDKQRADFLPLYNRMRDEIMRDSREARDKAKAVKDKGAAATDADYDSATEAYLDFRSREAETIRSYYRKFSHILTRQQLFKLDAAERKFDRMLIQHTGKGKGRKGNNIPPNGTRP